MTHPNGPGNKVTRGGVSAVDVLVVEDDPDVRDFLRELIEQDGFVVRTASHGLEALAVLRERPLPRLVFLDLRMPIMSGWELLAAMSADVELRSLPVVVFSGEPLASTLDLPVAAVLRKPAGPRLVVSLVRRHLGCAAPAALAG